MNGVTGAFDVVGAHAARKFFGWLDPARLAHGYLFSGPAGVGKKTFARALAQSLLCETPKDTLLGYCDSCTGCTLFVARTHPDFIESEGVVKIGKDSASSSGDEDLTARDLVRELAMHGYRSRFHVVLLGDVSYATHEAANALLRTIEEPPEGVVVMMTSNAPGSLLETIRSRLLEIAFAPLSVSEVESALVRGGTPGPDARRAAESSLGSITRARESLDVDARGIREASFAWFEDVMDGAPGDAGFLNLDDRSLTGAQKRENVRALIEIVRIAARDWATSVLASGAVMPFAGDQRERLARIAARDPKSVTALLGALGEVERLSHTNVSPGLVVDYLRAQLSPLPARR
jgi:DNA polymerase III, delta subunit